MSAGITELEEAVALLKRAGYIVVKEEDVDLLTVQVSVLNQNIDTAKIDIKGEEKRSIRHQFGEHLDHHGFIKWLDERDEVSGRTLITARLKVFK